MVYYQPAWESKPKAYNVNPLLFGEIICYVLHETVFKSYILVNLCLVEDLFKQ